MLVGIDTGGTYTDAVLYDPNLGSGAGVIASAKALTRTDLTVGIREALSQVVSDPAAVSMVAVSTTLATNALVEGAGARAALVFIGFDEADLHHKDLQQGLAGSPVITVDGGHESLGSERAPLDVEALVAAASEITEQVDAFAITSRFAVRNPAHELAAAEALAPLGKPVACGHQLTAKLNGPRRALTCLLNARLIGLIGELCGATEKILAELSINAPLLMVRGDGSLVAAKVVRERPIETILSGPAASLIGAAHLVSASDLLVSDIGGTTTDVGVLRGGHPMVAKTGAVVGGHQTMVEAVEMFTHGLGGDSEVTPETTMEPTRLSLGPRRIVPLSMAAIDGGDNIGPALAALEWPFRLDDTRFIRATGRTGPLSGTRAEQLMGKIGADWLPASEVVTSGLQISTLRGLVGQGLVEIAGFTPTDAAHVLGIHDAGDRSVAIQAADIVAQIGDLRGEPIRPDGESFSRWVIDSVVRRSGEVVLAAALARDGIAPGEAIGVMAQRALDRNHGMVNHRLELGVPLVALGASAPTYYPAVGELLNADCRIPSHSGVANALGAAVGQIRLVREATISQPSKGKYRVHIPGLEDRADLQPAIDDALAALGELVRTEADAAGAASITLHEDVNIKQVAIEGRDFFVEGTVTVVGVGPPKLADFSSSAP